MSRITELEQPSHFIDSNMAKCLPKREFDDKLKKDLFNGFKHATAQTKLVRAFHRLAGGDKFRGERRNRMGFFSRLFGTDPEGVYKTCVPVYKRARARRPNRPQRDYLKLVLLRKPPYDYQADAPIDQVLEEFRSTEDLASFIANRSDPYNREAQKYVWEARERNLKLFPRVRARNQAFFKEFWG